MVVRENLNFERTGISKRSLGLGKAAFRKNPASMKDPLVKYINAPDIDGINIIHGIPNPEIYFHFFLTSPKTKKNAPQKAIKWIEEYTDFEIKEIRTQPQGFMMILK